MSEFIARRVRSGQTMRYHTTPHIGKQSVAEHSWRACVLMHTLWPNKVTKNALLWMLYHDSPEQELGDVPAPAKWKFPDLHAVYGEAERLTENHLEISDIYEDLTPDEKVIISIADMLECLDYVAHSIMRGDHSFEARHIYWNARKHLDERFRHSGFWTETFRFMDHLHRQVVQVCPAVASHVS